MTSEQLEVLDSVMDEIVSRIEKYPLHLQPTILKILWAERNGAPQMVAGTEVAVTQAQHVNGSSALTVEAEPLDWDFRRGLDQIAEQHDFDLKSPYDYEHALIVSHVLQFLSPPDFDGAIFTTELVNEAWRHADRDIPNRPRQPINDAVKKGLLEKAKVKPGYVLTPKGENYVKKLLADGELS